MMNGDNKRIIICLPNQPILSGVMTLKFAKEKAEEKSQNINEIITPKPQIVIFCLLSLGNQEYNIN